MSATDPLEEVERLRRRAAALEAENQRLRELERAFDGLNREQEQLRDGYRRLNQEHGQLREQYSQASALTEGLQAQLREAQEELAELRRQLFGTKADRLDAEEKQALQIVSEDLLEQAQRDPAPGADILEDEDTTAGQRPRRARRHPMPDHLERREEVLEPGGVPACGHCGGQPGRIGEETSEEYEYVPARLVVHRLVRPKYACRCGDGPVRIAPMPPRLLPQSRLGTALAVHLMLGRFDDHVAYYTLERIFRERHGVVIPRQQMVQWVDHIAGLLRPLWRLLIGTMREGGYIQVDETPVRVMDPEVHGKCARGYLWFYAVPGGDVFLDFQDTRGGSAPSGQLKDFEGTIQTDAYEVYDSFRKTLPRIERIGCVAHARRKFHVALRNQDKRALEFIARIQKLYRIENETRGARADDRHRIRLERALPIWAELKERAKALEPVLLPKESLGKAVSYLLREYDALIGYTRDGRFQIDNNLVENSIRVPAVGRRRWLFIGHPDAGWRSAVIYSLIISCRRRGINPQEYLDDVLRKLPTITEDQLPELLPGRWRPAAPPPVAAPPSGASS